VEMLAKLFKVSNIARGLRSSLSRGEKQRSF
jgi:hypothetical protein